ncbi:MULTISPECIES: Dabb family protein [Microbispora]|uniref:Dabb family protein n=2 Tax=Microbispora TaxID=2005 RepID=A0ABY3LVQ2_9ACTN|nr:MULTISPECIES: Dabb family protein [Microbispora]TLP57991.1 Dabb family protein [Microbispora fusca]TYB56294.1 Dabb family protein [Microbispora tritici]
MFRHIVLLKWTDDATEEQRAEVARRLNELPGVIPEIRTYQIGLDAGVNQGNFSFAVTAEFDSPEDYIVYRDHPAHLAVIEECIAQILAARAAVQYAL